MTRKKIVIIGGGASGLIAAIVAARNGANVVILEQMDKVGKKILATGNGRCNITNIYANSSNYHGSCKNFSSTVFEKFSVDQTIDFFENLGIHTKIENEGKVYPNSDQASSVLDVLSYEVNRLKIEEKCGEEVINIKKSKNDFIIKTVNNRYESECVIVASGGMASPKLGSNGSGYELVKKLGHKITDIFPALVQLKLEGKFFKKITGVKFIGVAAIVSDKKIKRQEEGEILFTNYGISGPPILQLSRLASEFTMKNENVEIHLDLFPKYNFKQLEAVMVKRINQMSYKTIEDCMIGLINKKLIRVVLTEAGIKDVNITCENITIKQIRKIVSLLKKWVFKVTGTNSWMQAQVTAGGVKCHDISEKTLESKLVKGLYLTGELLDLDGDCGGYNLQWAWSSGYVAGYNASLSK